MPGDLTPDPIVVTISAQGGDGKLLGNLLGSLSTLINFEGVEGVTGNILGTVVDLVNSVDLTLPGTVGSGVFDTGSCRVHEILDVFIAPVNLDLLGLVVTTSPIHLTITAHSGDGLILGNVVSALATCSTIRHRKFDGGRGEQPARTVACGSERMIPSIVPAATPSRSSQVSSSS